MNCKGSGHAAETEGDDCSSFYVNRFCPIKKRQSADNRTAAFLTAGSGKTSAVAKSLLLKSVFELISCVFLDIVNENLNFEVLLLLS